MAKTLPQLPARPVVGHVDEDLWTLIQDSHQQLGDAFALRILHQRLAVFVSPEANKAILVEQHKHLSAAKSFGPMSWMLGRGLALIDGAYHHHMRRLVLPAFHQQVIAQSLALITAIAEETAVQWAQLGRIDAQESSRNLTLRTMLKVLFGQDSQSETERLSPMLGALFESLLIDPKQPRTVLGFSRMLKLPGVPNLRQRLDRYLYQLIDEHQVSDDILGILKAAQYQSRPLSKQAIRDQLLTFMVAGHDTTAMGLMWLLYLLAKHPQHIEAIAAEAAAGTPAQAAPYLDAVVKEALRLYPPIALGIRVATEDLTIMGYQLKRGTMVVYSPFLSQRHPDLWDEPARFKPERFLPGQVDPYHYLPFGGGAHHCIGKTFAELEIKTILLTFIRRLRWSLCCDEEPGLTLKPTLSPVQALQFKVHAIS